MNHKHIFDTFVKKMLFLILQQFQNMMLNINKKEKEDNEKTY